MKRALEIRSRKNPRKKSIIIRRHVQEYRHASIRLIPAAHFPPADIAAGAVFLGTSSQEEVRLSHHILYFQLEAASGGVDEEARAMLTKLHGVVAMPLTPKAEDAAQVASMSEEQLKAHLENIEGQMSAVEALLAGSSDETKSLVAQSATLWSGKDNGMTKKDQE